MSTEKKTIPSQEMNTGFFEIIENANVGILVHRNFETLYVNDYMAKISGYDNRDEYKKLADNFSQIHPDDRDFVISNASKRLEGDASPLEYEFRAIKKGGGIIWLSCRAFQMMWEGEPALTALFKDITAEKTGEVELNKLQLLFESTLELCPEIVTVTDYETGEYIMVNHAFTSFIGVTKEEAIGKTPLDFELYPNAEYRNKLFQSLEKNTPVKGLEIEAKNKAGENFIGVFNATRISVEGRDLILFMGHDQTKERMIHSHLKRSLEEADIANRTKNELLANMSHELRTPLNAILGFSDFIKMELVGPVGSKKYLEYAAWIHESGHHLLDIINDVLDLSKIENDSFELDRVNINFHSVLDETLPFIQSPLQRKSQSLTLNLIDGDPIIDSDSRRIKQIILNILSNAIKFTPKDGEIAITTALTDDNYLSITFKDNGIGMTTNEMKRAREPFGRATTSNIKNQEGTGLGLPLCISFVEALMGTIVIKSEKDEGTEITIKLPLAASKD
jgi:PAS domain S-box-containing protein